MFSTAAFLAVALIAITLPLIVSIAVATRPEARPSGVRDYFLFEEKLSAGDFRRTSVGYSLQAAAIFLFLYWTFAYGFSSIFVPICWFLGYVVLYWFYKRGYLNEFLNADGQTRTIHGFFAHLLPKSNAAKVLVFMAVSSTLFGIGGTMVVEADYVMNWLVTSLSLQPSVTDLVIQLGTAFILGFAILYVLWGGYRAVILTDQLQVPIAYFSFGFFTILIGLIGVMNFASGWSFVALIVILFLFAGLTYFQARFTMGSEDPLWSRAPVFMGLACAATVAIVISISAIGVGKLEFQTSALPPLGEGFLGFGVIGVVSLVVANVIWQVIDISSLQRLQSVSELALSGNEIDQNSIREAIYAAGLESAAAWALIIVAGYALFFLGVTDPFGVASALRAEGVSPLIGMAAIFFFLFALSAFAISTIDAFVSAMAYVSYFDVLGLKADHASSQQAGSLRSAKWVTIFAAISIVAAYYVLKALASSESLPQILYAIYAVQLSIFPLVLDAFLRGKIHVWGGLIAVPIGWVVAFFTAMQPPHFGIFEDSWSIIPPLAVCVTTTVIYVFARFLFRAR